MDKKKEWIQFKGAGGFGGRRHIVLVSGDEEYRSEEAMPMLAKILATHYGFDCTVLFAVDPDTGQIDPRCQTNIPGLHHLETADLMILFTRFRELPDEQMKHIIDYTHSGRPVMGLRTATHAFRYTRNPNSPYAKYDWKSETFEGGYGRQVLGETWINHYGHHGHESTRGLINPEFADHPILKGVKDVWGPTDVYSVGKLTGSPDILLEGQVLTGMDPSDAPKANTPTMPIAWIKKYTGEENKTSRVFCTTMGAAPDLKCADLRRLLLNAACWCMEEEIDGNNCVDTIGEFNPTYFGSGMHRKGLRPSDYE
ncbi:MAG: ThuA domain-containing protein [bacterium]|nr:ThuA domain-containing protein [bacterium]